MDQSDFRDEDTGLCKLFKPKEENRLIINIEDRELYDYYNSKSCYKGNLYADYCEYCGRDLCLYYKPEINLVPEGESKIVIIENNKPESKEDIPIPEVKEESIIESKSKEKINEGAPSVPHNLLDDLFFF